ncbi:MAG: ribosome small subunit-dependent GTPase A [Gemmatimonadota bacterium]
MSTSSRLVSGRVLKIVAGTYHVRTDEGILQCSLRGRAKRGEDTVAVGDVVRVERLGDGSCRIRERLRRTSALTRHSVARRREQVIAANVDQVASVVAVASPAPDLSLVDRLLVLAELDGLTGFVVANKCDLLARDAPLPEEFAPYADAGYEVVPTSAVDGTGLETLAAHLSGHITVFVGPSGVGKSSLLNALDPDLDLRVGELGRNDLRGRHTTVAATFHPFGGDGYVVDTPGLQYLKPWEADPQALSQAFPEIRSLSAHCRFADCRHVSEPDCAVIADLRVGKVDPRRYRTYRALLAAAEQDS